MYKTIVGLEIHVELKTKSKMFCNCCNDSDEKSPNLNICPVCMGHPGTLPVINKGAVKKVIKTGLALNCQIPKYSKFDRKNYFYPDLPKGYQISQLYFPFCKKGFLKIKGKKIRIREIHLEEDTGKLIHPRDRGEAERSVADECESIHRAKGADHSLVDFNRAGLPLMELVTEPDIHSAREAKQFAEELQMILRYLRVSDADMEKGQMRIEVNISLTKTKRLGTKVEIKNLNSFKSVEKGIDYEIKRQTEILSKGKKVIQETRGWLDERKVSSRRVDSAREHDAKGITFSQRKKEESYDYRYFPEPDLPLLCHSEEFIQKIKAKIVELPEQRRERFKKEYNLSEKEIEIFVSYKDLGEYFEKVVSELVEWVKTTEIKTKISETEKQKLNSLSGEKNAKHSLNKLAANYIISDLQGLLKEKKGLVSDKNFKITPENFAEFICLIYQGKISSKIAKIVLEEMFKTGADPSHIIKEKGLFQITDVSEIEKIAKEVMSKNPRAIEDFKKGKENAFQYLIGQIMSQSRGKANPQIINETLKKYLMKIK